MPKRILLLAALYVVASAGLAALMLVPYEIELIAEEFYYLSDLSYLLLFFAYLTIATPLGLWGALGKTPLAGRIAVCTLPAFLLAGWVALNPLLALVQEFALDQAPWTEFPAYLEQFGQLDSALWTLMSGVLLFLPFLAPTALGGVLGGLAKRRGLQVAMPGESTGAAIATRFSLRQLLLLMLGVSALLAVQPILEDGMIFGDPENPLEALAARDALPADALPPEAMPAQMTAEEAAFIEATINGNAVGVDYDFDLDDDFEPLSAAEMIVQTASTAVANGTPFIIASVICIWTMLFAESPWRRLIWGAPFAIFSGVLVVFHDTDLLSAMIAMTLFFTAQAALLWVVRSTGYRLVWTLKAEADAAMAEDSLSVFEPAMA